MQTFFTVETQNDFIQIDASQGSEFGEIQILLAACVKDSETVDHLESRNLTKPQIEALISALQEAKKALR